MTAFDERVYLRFRGHTTSLPLAAMALTLGKNLEDAARSLEILILGPPESRPTAEDPRPVHRRIGGEGTRGGVYPGRSERPAERSGTIGTSSEQNLEERPERRGAQRSERSDAPAREDTDDETLARMIAIDLGDEENLAVIRSLVRRHARDHVDRALREALAVPAHRVRASRAAIFTATVRRLAAHSPNTSRL
jgi:hypothetical protein